MENFNGKKIKNNELKGEKNMNNLPVYLFHQGTNYRSYEFLGAHLIKQDGEDGVVFRVWAPNAQQIAVVGDFNRWNVNQNVMRRISEGGIWEAFVSGAKEGARYKFAVTTAQKTVYKADPFAFYSELSPSNCSIVCDVSGYEFKASDYEEKRRTRDIMKCPVNIYEINLASWKKKEDGSYYTYTDLKRELVPYVKEMGYTHVEFMPVTEFPYDGSWGYQVTGYFSITSRFGSVKEFMALVDAFHQADVGVILDWVPAHFPRDEFGLSLFDGTFQFEDGNPQRQEHKAWGTLIFDFGKTEVQSFLISSAFYLFEVCHVDGLRVDAVASMLYLDYDRKDGEWSKNALGTNINLEAVAFLQKLNSAVLSAYPHGLMIAEESTAFPMVTMPPHIGGLGFNFKWNMGWMNDVLSYVKLDPYFRSNDHNKLTFSMMYAFSENFILPISHDEVVYGKGSLINKMPGDYEQKFASTRAFMGYMMSHPGKKLMFMGQEYGQFSEWDNAKGLEFFMLDYPMHGKLHAFYKDLNAFYRENEALYSVEKSWDGFEWLVADDNQNNTLAFKRTGENGQQIIAIINFSGASHEDYRIGVEKGKYQVVFSSDAAKYGGSAQFKNRIYNAKKKLSHGKPYSISVNVAPLSFIYLEKV